MFATPCVCHDTHRRSSPEHDRRHCGPRSLRFPPSPTFLLKLPSSPASYRNGEVYTRVRNQINNLCIDWYRSRDSLNRPGINIGPLTAGPSLTPNYFDHASCFTSSTQCICKGLHARNFLFARKLILSRRHSRYRVCRTIVISPIKHFHQDIHVKINLAKKRARTDLPWSSSTPCYSASLADMVIDMRTRSWNSARWYRSSDFGQARSSIASATLVHGCRQASTPIASDLSGAPIILWCPVKFRLSCMHPDQGSQRPIAIWREWPEPRNVSRRSPKISTGSGVPYNV